MILAFGCESELGILDPPLEEISKNSASFLVSEDLAKQSALGFFKSDSSFWGWNDKTNSGETRSTNGYYGSGVFTPFGSTSTYNNNLKMITGLR